MPIWCFKSAVQRTRDAVTHQWYWQIDTQGAIAVTSQRLFPTLEACIADAREHGFRGEVDPPQEVTHPAVIPCEEGDYVHAIVHRSVAARSAPRSI